MTDSLNQAVFNEGIASNALYDYMCQNITGDEKVVRTKRLITAIQDICASCSSNSCTFITSGSFGEGLELKGSDTDLMDMIKSVCVYGSLSDIHHFESDKFYFVTDMDNTKPGFTLLKLIRYNYGINEICPRIGDDYYLSSYLLKKTFLGIHVHTVLNTVHGPCLSDEKESLDVAYFLHSKKWLPAAQEWTTRSNTPWPDLDLKANIINHGIPFVPIGNKGSVMEDLEWRLSFSVGEKMLICSFRHTQLLCYALMKIFLKEVLDLKFNCKGLLCSYHLKTIMFWISEELPLSIWRPDNLTSCFMACLHRLIYFVRLLCCPHYFIPENNLFSKMKDYQQYCLLENLLALQAMGWRCLYLSEQLSMRKLISPNKIDLIKTKSKYYSDILNSKCVELEYNKSFNNSYGKTLYKCLHCRSNRLKSFYMFNMTSSCKTANEQDNFCHTYGMNKNKYRQYKTCMAYLLQSVFHDAITGWLCLASYFYKKKQYESALYVLTYSLTKYLFEWIDSDALQKKGFVFMLRAKLFKAATITYNRSLIPTELEISEEFCVNVLPSFYAHFLCFLCHYRQQNNALMINEFQKLLVYVQTLEKHKHLNNPHISGMNYLVIEYILLGTALKLLGHNDKARCVYLMALQHDSYHKMYVYRLLLKLDN